MTHTKFSILCFLFCFFGWHKGNTQPKSISAIRTDAPVLIDARLNETEWGQAVSAKDFIQISPDNGKPSDFETTVKFLFDNSALYVAAFMIDKTPESIMQQLSQRDEINQADFFGIYIDPFGDAKNAFGFFVTVSGVQVDMKMTPHNEDSSWDAVWESQTALTDSGWVLELRIPYSALRFPKSDAQKWKINMFRNIQSAREKSSWCFLDRSVDNQLSGFGNLEGITNIEPPVRLSLIPYLAAYIENKSDQNTWNKSLKGGLDLKYGISDNFTLDMMLVPDFGQVPSDDKILNLSPFETFYDEKRSFFTEGTELFSRGGIFYSRRIGGRPYLNQSVTDSLGNNEKIHENPQNTQLINATKISGKTAGGLGLGFLNAMNTNTWATIIDTTSNQKRKLLTQPFTNYNVMVADQSFGKNSYVSVINTNVYSPEWDYMANVAATDFKITGKEGKYSVWGLGGFSHIKDRNEDSTGYGYSLSAGKISGNFLFSCNHSLLSEKFNPNDLGYLENNNEIENTLSFQYNIYKPFWKLLEWYNTLNFTHSMLYEHQKYIMTTFHLQSVGTFRNYLTAFFTVEGSPTRAHNYYESRTPGSVFIDHKWVYANFGISPDYRKKFLADMNTGIWKAEYKSRFTWWFNISPRLRFNNHFFMVYSFQFQDNRNDFGYYDKISNDSIMFSKRTVKIVNNTLSATYYFTPKSNLSFRARHYWSGVKNHCYYVLQTNGYLMQDTTGYSGNHETFNSFTIDLVYNWQFAPGSILSLVWKNAIESDEKTYTGNYFDNIDRTFNTPQANNFSIKLLYYLDYSILSRKTDVQRQ